MSDPTAESNPRTGIWISKLNVSAGNRVLLRDADAHFEMDQITLVVGPSGVGKSVLLRMIAGLLEPTERGIQSSGEITIKGESVSAGQVGVVFQSFALFDEMSPQGNVEFARACGAGHANQLTNQELLKRLNIPSNVPTSRLSGGQQQRLAIARTIAFNPPIILYDEPTSGLDPGTGKRVAELIRRTHDEFGETTVVVTHDYLSLLPIADCVYLIDPAEKRLLVVDRADWNELPRRLDDLSQPPADETETLAIKSSWRQGLRNWGVDFFEQTANVFCGLLLTVAALLPRWRRPWWGLRYTAFYSRLVFGPTALIYMILSGVISGFVMTFFTFKFLPYSTYTEPLLIEDLLIGLGFAMYRITVPVLSCVLIAARCGAAVASDIGGRQYGNQINAMRSLGASPDSYLLTPIVWSFLIGTPLLTLVSYVAGRLTSLITFVNSYPLRGPDFWYEHFHRGLIVPGQFTYVGTHWLLAKLLCSGMGIAATAYVLGRQPKYSSADVSRCITTTILVATIYVLVVHFIFSFYEYEGVVPGAKLQDGAG